MFARMAGRLLTSPIAFLAAGLLDFLLFVSATIWRSVCCLTQRMRHPAPKIERR